MCFVEAARGHIICGSRTKSCTREKHKNYNERGWCLITRKQPSYHNWVDLSKIEMSSCSHNGGIMHRHNCEWILPCKLVWHYINRRFLTETSDAKNVLLVGFTKSSVWFDEKQNAGPYWHCPRKSWRPDKDRQKHSRQGNQEENASDQKLWYWKVQLRKHSQHDLEVKSNPALVTVSVSRSSAPAQS